MKIIFLMQLRLGEAKQRNNFMENINYIIN